MQRPLTVSLALLLCLLLSACGQKGPLYLPAPEPVDPPAENSEEEPEEARKKAP